MGWLCGAGGEERFVAKMEIREPRIINRGHRRKDKRNQRLGLGRHSSGSSEIAILFYLFGRGVSRTQFMERMCRLSLYGRVRIFGIRSWGTVLVRRALLICYDHGWWRAPIGEFGRVRHGFWHVHLWPEWGWRACLGIVLKEPALQGVYACAGLSNENALRSRERILPAKRTKQCVG